MIAACTTQFWRSRRMSRRPAAFFAALVVFIIVIFVAAPEAQQPPAFAPSPTSSPTVRDATTPTDIDLLVGRSTVLNVGSAITRVSLTVPDIADAMVTTPTQLLIHGKTPGTISLFVWDKSGAIKTYEVNVRRDLNALAEHLRQLFPGEPISVLGSGKDVVISGTVSSKYVIEKAADVAGGYVEKKDNVVNLLKQQEGVASNQVMLRVRFAEVSRSAVQELGASFFTGPTGYKDWIARSTTQQFSAPNFSELSRTADLDDNLTSASGKYTLSDFLNLFVFSNKYNIGTVIRALSEKGLFQSLAEPNLIASNGKEASFLAGGEYPYPVVQPGAGGAAVSITFKEFGIRLTFTPTVLGGDLINLKVKPEVSALDFSNAIVLEGFRVPALSTRRTETEVELRDGQTFAIAGLLNNTVTDTMRKIPGIGDVPILGWLFKSKAMQKNQTELVVMITPTIIKRGQMGVSEGLPSPVENYMGRPDHTKQNPDPYTGSPRYPSGRTSSENTQPAPAAAPKNAAPAPASKNNAAPTTAPRSSAPSTLAPTPLTSRPVTTQPGTAVPNYSAPGPGPKPSQPDFGTPGNAVPRPSSVTSPAQQSAPAASPYAPAPGPTTPAPATSPYTPAATAPAPGTSPYAPAPGPTAPAPGTSPYAPMPTPAAAPPPLTKDQARAMEKAKEYEKRAAEAEARQRAAEQKAVQDKAAENKRQADRLSKERAQREAEIARKNAENTRRQAEQDQKREKALAEAADRLKQAQAVYQSELEKAKGGTNEKPKDPGKGTGPSAPKQ